MKTVKEKRDAFISAGSEIEPELKQIFKKDPEVIFDIGACEGLSTIIYSKLFPNAIFGLFEPLLQNCEIIRENLKEYGIQERCKIFQVACSNQDGVGTFHVSSGQAPGVDGWDAGNKSSSLLPPQKHLQEHRWCEFTKTEKVEIIKLDSHDFTKPVFVHMDVQGAELMVLTGGKKTFSETKAFWIEVANIHLYAGQPLKSHISRYMDQAGYYCMKDTCGMAKYGDMLWVKK